MEIFQNIFLLIAAAAFIIIWGYGVVQWFKAVTNMFALTREYKPEINPWSWRTGFNPLNGLVITKWLTPKGKEHAKQCWVAIGKFILVVTMPIAAAFSFEFITGINLFPK